jgi:hypothetical protein
VDSVEQLEAAVQDPRGFLGGLLKELAWAARGVAVAKLRPRLEPPLAQRGLEWEDVVPALMEVR